MYITKSLGHLTIEWAIDETIPGRHPNCACCQVKLLKEDERVVLRKDQPNSQGVREGVFLCGKCSREVSRGIEQVLGEEDANSG